MLVGEAYINGLGCISPQHTFESNALPKIINLPDEIKVLKCVEPIYKKYLDPMASRRMSRIIKMGIYAAKLCLEDSHIQQPDAIITGTGLGCLEDTEKFITALIRNKEQILNPTPFIQSTHNTISSQIAMSLECNSYNTTYAHRGLSFESALLDGMLLLKEKSAENVLIGGTDEITGYVYDIQKRLGHWRKHYNDLSNIPKGFENGSCAGEGSAFFLLSNNRSDSTYSKVLSLETIIEDLNTESLVRHFNNFIEKNNLMLNQIDLLLLGLNGDSRSDHLYYSLMSTTLRNNSCAYFKHLCGDYPTAISFAFWLASGVLKSQAVYERIMINTMPSKVKTILIYNHYRNINHSFILMQSC